MHGSVAAEVRLDAGRLEVDWPGIATWSGIEVRWREPGVAAAAGGGHTAGGWSALPDRPGRFTAGSRLLEVELALITNEERMTLQLVVRTDRGGAGAQQIGLAGRLTLAGARAPGWALCNGYQSWDEAVLKPVDRDRESWWTLGVAAERGGGLALAAVEARRMATRFRLDGRAGVGGEGGSGRSEVQLALEWCQPVDYGRAVPLVAVAEAPGEWRSEPVVLAAADDVQQALAALATVPGGAPETGVPRGWLPWYQYGPWAGQEEVLAHAGLLSREPFSRLGYRIVQVDDGWQMAYGEWVPNTKFPDGLRSLSERLAALGLTLGIWTAPFLVSVSSDLDAGAPEDWFVRDPATGERAVEPRHVVFGPMHVLNGAHPEVQRHLRELFARLYADGVRYFKVDFLYAGGYPGIHALRAGLEAIREGAADAYLLASGAPLLPVVGLADGCRVGPDTATPWYDFESGTSHPATFGDEVLNVCRNAALRHHLRGWFQLDADAALTGGDLGLEQARQLVTVAALSGGPFFASDDLTRLEPERLALLTNEEVLALAGGEPAVPDWEPDAAGRPPTRWRRGPILALFNWSAEDRPIEVRAPGAVGARDLWRRHELPELRDGALLPVPAHGVRLLRLHRR